MVFFYILSLLVMMKKPIIIDFLESIPSHKSSLKELRSELIAVRHQIRQTSLDEDDV